MRRSQDINMPVKSRARIPPAGIGQLIVHDDLQPGFAAEPDIWSNIGMKWRVPVGMTFDKVPVAIYFRVHVRTVYFDKDTLVLHFFGYCDELSIVREAALVISARFAAFRIRRRIRLDRKIMREVYLPRFPDVNKIIKCGLPGI